MTLSRRIFLRNGVITLAAMGGAAALEPRFLGRAAAAVADSGKPAVRKKILVCVFQRGAADGLSIVAPFGDPNYYKLRQEISIAQPKKGDTAAGLDLDGFFALHPRLDALLPMWKRNELAVIHACGSPNNSRSHFDMQDFMEAGTADQKSITTGWANRALAAQPPTKKSSPFRAVAMSGSVPRTLEGDVGALAIRDLASFGVNGGIEMAGGGGGATGFEGLYDAAADQVLSGAGKESFDAIAMLKKAKPTQYTPARGVTYPATSLGRSLLQVSQLIKANVGVEVAFVEDEGWDTHANQGGPFGQMAGKLLDFGRALAAFNTDLGDAMSDVLVLTMSEFGRAVRQNGNRGTDHGHGACFLAFGGSVKGGKVYGDWPTLAPEKLFEERDLAVTTDFRDVFGEICVRHLGVAVEKLSTVFPKHSIDNAKFRGLVKA